MGPTTTTTTRTRTKIRSCAEIEARSALPAHETDCHTAVARGSELVMCGSAICADGRGHARPHQSRDEPTTTTTCEDSDNHARWHTRDYKSPEISPAAVSCICGGHVLSL